MFNRWQAVMYTLPHHPSCSILLTDDVRAWITDAWFIPYVLPMDVTPCP